MSTPTIPTRQQFLQGLRAFTDWADRDSTIPVPDDWHVSIRLATPAAVATFAHVHDIPGPFGAGTGVTYADARFGPVLYRVYANGEQR